MRRAGCRVRVRLPKNIETRVRRGHMTALRSAFKYRSLNIKPHSLAGGPTRLTRRKSESAEDTRSQPAGWLSPKHAGLARPSHSPPACLNKAAACGDAGCGTRPAGGRWRGRTGLPRTQTEPTPPVWPEQGWRFVGMLDVDPGLQGAAVRSAVGALHPSAGPMAWPGGGQSAGSRCRGASECRTARRIQGHQK